MTPDIIRTWAKAQGMEIGDRGRVSQEIRDAYAEATNNLSVESVGARIRAASKPSTPRPPKPAKPRPKVRAETMRLPDAVNMTAGDPMRVKGEQGNWRFLAVVLEASGGVYVDCVDPAGIGRAIEPASIDLPKRGGTRETVRPSLAEREASATAHAQRRR